MQNESLRVPAPTRHRVARARGEIEQAQLAKARRLLARVLENPFYGPRYASAGMKPDRLASLEDWREFPAVDKKDLLDDQQQTPPYGSRLGVPLADIRDVHITSGTSGFGQEAFALTADDLDVTADAWQRPLAALGLGAGDLFATMYPMTFLAYGRSLLAGGTRAGTPVISMAGSDAHLAVELMQRLRPAAVGARPAFLRIVEEVLGGRGSTPREAFPGLRGLLCSGLAPSTIPATQETWGAVVHEVYGSSQAAGIIASTGREGAAPGGAAGLMYCIEEHFLIETVDPQTLAPVTSGDAELILTCLDRVASPVVRYRTGDRVSVVAPGTEDNNSPYVAIRVGSIGRLDDMLKIRGNNVWPQQLEEALLAHPDVADFLAEVTLDDRGVDVLTVSVRRRPGGAAADDLSDEIRRRAKRATNVTPRVIDRPDLPAPGLKPKRLVDRRAAFVD